THSFFSHLSVGLRAKSSLFVQIKAECGMILLYRMSATFSIRHCSEFAAKILALLTFFPNSMEIR
ncbi:MAG: hypothetical protein KAY77_02230, partial [Oscillospiraceae bacterium]|nr:hypothetical protein [Oscillospiraceae bacterium]